MSAFTRKTLLITGGTGSFGNAVLNRFLSTDIGEIRVFSRDEKKQDDMRHEFQVKMPDVSDKIKFFIGDVRDLQSVRNAMHGVDYNGPRNQDHHFQKHRERGMIQQMQRRDETCHEAHTQQPSRQRLSWRFSVRRRSWAKSLPSTT